MALNDTKRQSNSLAEEELATAGKAIEEGQSEGAQFLQDIVENTKKQHELESQVPRYPYNVVGTVLSCASHSQAIVSFCIDKQTYQYQAITTQPLKPSDAGENCLLSFQQGYLDQPIITGIIQSEATDPAQQAVVLQSDIGIHLQCGASSISLDDNGTINIQGMHINSQAYGPHRIKGGSVKIN